ncbi:mitochondrial processing peptidase [Phakopsora pachyrhizi]|nr:mitochondrial processing peptidase [Phakopsora pachyrhizi]
MALVSISKYTPSHFLKINLFHVFITKINTLTSKRLRGTAHLTDWMAFKAKNKLINHNTENQTAKQISLEIEQLGSSFFDSSGRDTVVYQATSYPDVLPSVMSVLSDTTLNPLLIQSELSYMIPELLHEIAYPNNTLGLPLICQSNRIQSITPEILWEYCKLFYRPDRIVVAGLDVENDDFLRHTKRYFGKFRSIQPPQKPWGGELRLPDTTESNLAHFYLGFEAPSFNNDDLYAIGCASGPGKGVYSRLYNGLLNPYPEVDFFQAFHHTYANSGLLGIAITVTPEFASMVPRVLASQLDKISRTHTRGGITELKSRLLQVEDLGRQVQTAGRKKTCQNYRIWKRIKALTIKDINRAVSRIIRPESGGFSGEPTIVATGQIEQLGDVKKILSRRLKNWFALK